MEMFSFNTIEIILLSITGFFLLIQIFYYLCIYNRIHSHNKAVSKGNIDFATEYQPLSVIIRACNESDNLKRNLEYILQQDYPTFEVIVINDGSTDESEEYLKQMEMKYNNLYHSFTPEQIKNISSKKLALTVGIKASKYEWLVFTEANCRPVSNQWLKLIARNFTQTTEIVLGYNNLTYQKCRYNRLASFDNLFHSMRYLGITLNDKPYMGIGRNMAYKKHLFFDNKGFSNFLELYRGEDDLFINKVSNNINTRVETSKDSVVRINSEEYTAMSWKEDSIDYLITSEYYKGGQRNLFGFETLTRFLFYFLAISAIVLGSIDFHWLVAGISFIAICIRFIVQCLVINHAARDFGDKRRFSISIFYYDFYFPIRNFFLRFSKLMRKSKHHVNSNMVTHNAWN
jgi:glycosyltransferase involved in cell wall biosynthesis